MMTGRKWLTLAVAACMCLSFAGCGSREGAVYVQSVAKLSQLGGIAPGDRFSGMVVSENVTEIQKDADKTIKQLSVREGDDVKVGQELFAYDTEQLQLTLDKQRLEREQLLASIENYTDQIAQLEKDRERAGTRDRLQYTVQIQTMQVDKKEAELNLKTKETEVAKSEDLLNNASVKSPVTGRIQAISENGTDNYGNPLPYITIQQTGSYRVKGTISELQRGGIMEGDRIRMVSRTDENQVWLGTVTLVDYENPTQNNNNGMYMGGMSDEMSSSSKYPFYVELDSSDGMILGQHLYLELDSGEEETALMSIGGAFVCFDEDGTTYVWADNGRGKLEKRAVALGEYNFYMDTYEILSGLLESDYIAFPDAELCHAGAPTTKVEPSVEDAEGGVA